MHPYSTSPLSPSSFDHTSGTHKVHYQPHQQWDFFVDSDDRPVDLSLTLPHYRAHNQPVGHRMKMYVHSERHEIKAKVCRRSLRSPFFLAVHSSSAAPVTLYLPSDFSGIIRIPSPDTQRQKVSFSAGFSNHILPRVRFTSSTRMQSTEGEGDSLDEVEVFALGPITLRMWDVAEGAPEKASREVWRRLLKRSSSTHVAHKNRERQPAIDWDFLLDD
ncbi:hypothetical protein DENSPDRAFT_858889 [Dentipellis sp. KUC8613]|nr:hypothetical protein DENSPDRAFT_858889 [Dentipellis sp. KUC8613]